MVFEEAMKMRMRMKDLELWGVPTFIVNIWEKNYSPYLLPVQEKAVKEFRILDYKHHKHNIREGSEGEINWGIGFPYHYEKESQSRHLLVVAPTTSGKTFTGNAFITDVTLRIIPSEPVGMVTVSFIGTCALERA